MSEQESLTLYDALSLLLCHVDYTAGLCSPTDMVADVLSKEVIRSCKRLLQAEEWKNHRDCFYN